MLCCWAFLVFSFKATSLESPAPFMPRPSFLIRALLLLTSRFVFLLFHRTPTSLGVQVFQVARRAGFAPEEVQLQHVPFGLVQGEWAVCTRSFGGTIAREPSVTIAWFWVRAGPARCTVRCKFCSRVSRFFAGRYDAGGTVRSLIVHRPYFFPRSPLLSMLRRGRQEVQDEVRGDGEAERPPHGGGPHRGREHPQEARGRGGRGLPGECVVDACFARCVCQSVYQVPIDLGFGYFAVLLLLLLLVPLLLLLLPTAVVIPAHPSDVPSLVLPPQRCRSRFFSIPNMERPTRRSWSACRRSWASAPSSTRTCR